MTIKINEITAKSGLAVAEVDGYLIHSKYNPEKEAQNIAQESLEPNYLHILHGYGYGYVLKELVKELKGNMQLIVYDTYLLKNEFKQEINKYEKVLYFDNIETLSDFIKEHLSKSLDRKVKVINSPNYENIFAEQHAELLSVVKDSQMENVITENTLRFFVEQWQENYIMNLREIIRNDSLRALENKYDIPVIVASGGPSLTKQIPILKSISENVIIIAAGSTINSLLAEGIEPDYIVSLDGSLRNYEHFKSLGELKSGLIFALSSHYKIQQDYNGKQYGYIYSNEANLQGELETLFDVSLPMINAGGTVATAAMHIATYISNKPVALIGQDLAYTNNESHAKHNLNYDELNENLLKSKGAFLVEGYLGDKVYTDYAFVSMKKAFNLIYNLLKNEHSIFNCTEGGIKIDNIPQLEFKVFCEKYVSSSKKTKEAFIAKDIVAQKERYIALSNRVEEELIKYDELEHILKKCLRQLKKSLKFQSLSGEILNKLDMYDKEIKNLFKEVRMEQITELLIVSILRDYKQKNMSETKEEQFKRIYQQNTALYENLLDYCKKSKRFTLNLQGKILSDMGL